MCGLSGMYHLDGSPIDPATLEVMNKLIRHRGPDDEGYVLIHTPSGAINPHSGDDSMEEIKFRYPQVPLHTEANLGIGFRRLSIIDTSAKGHQPMLDVSRKYVLSFNGEIYNYREIREELKKLGYSFDTESDSEVLLKAYIQWDIECLSRFIGMFAFVIYDDVKKRLFAARDRLGIKPFLYYFDGFRLIWGSEEKQFVKSNAVDAVLHEESMIQFLRDHSLFENPNSFFKDLIHLPAGSFMLADRQGMHLHKYWSIHIPEEADMLQQQEAEEKIQSVLTDSIRLRLRSDVPLGIALSGGIDSSSIACLARDLTETQIRTFSVFYEGSRYDERQYIQAVLDRGGFQSTFYTADNRIQLQEIEKWIYQLDAPTTSASPFSAYQNYRNVRSAGIIVLLNGQGGDELFAGYPYYIKYFLAQLITEKKYASFFSNIASLQKMQGTKTAIAQAYLAWHCLKDSRSKLRSLEFSKYSTLECYPRDYPLSAEERNTETSFITDALYHSVVRTHLPHMLRWEDRNSMAHSIESRVPFLDHRLVELAFKIPASLKIQKGTLKYILRNSMKGKVPDSILNRTDKIGFGTPTDEWTNGILKNEVRDILHSESFLSRNWIYGTKVKDRYEKDPSSFGVNELWRIINAELWHRQFMD